jgi:hypothetical protein
VGGCPTAEDSVVCQKIIKELQNPFYIGDQPGGTQSTGWVDAWMAAPSVYAIVRKLTMMSSPELTLLALTICVWW